MRNRRTAVSRTQAPALIVLGLIALGGCLRPGGATGAALDLESAAGLSRTEPSSGTDGIPTLLAWATPRDFLFLGCVADVGGGKRCTFTPDDCEGSDAATLTMHVEQGPNDSDRVTAVAVSGMVRTIDEPKVGAVVDLLRCGLPGAYTEWEYGVLVDFLMSEVYTTMLVPWPYADPPTTRDDTVLAMSRLAVNRGAVGDAITALGQALSLGGDTASVVTTAVVEAGFAMGLHLTPVPVGDSSRTPRRFIWRHGAEAYDVDTTSLRRGIELLDFAMRVPNAGVDWSEVPVWGGKGDTLVFTHTPSIAAMEEMNGVAHYVLGQALVASATASPSCATWRAADEALETGYSYLRSAPRIDEADDTDEHLAEAASHAVQRADSARRAACQAAAS